VAAGFAVAMKKGDLSFCTYRVMPTRWPAACRSRKVLGELISATTG